MRCSSASVGSSFFSSGSSSALDSCELLVGWILLLLLEGGAHDDGHFPAAVHRQPVRRYLLRVRLIIDIRLRGGSCGRKPNGDQYDADADTNHTHVRTIASRGHEQTSSVVTKVRSKGSDA
jgi:hypothetical protein